MDEEVAKLLNAAIAVHASDIYLLPKKAEYQIAFYLEGRFQIQQELSLVQAQRLINFLKFKADMNLSERRRPQLGAWTYQDLQQQVFCRLSSVGAFLGAESLVIRLIYPSLTATGYFFPEQFEQIKAACKQRGMVLFAGPMGSGKTTAMYSFAQSFKEQLIMTIEDPVEIYEPNFLQLQVNDKADMSYESLLNAALRLHPDIFIIGEIRNERTAALAVRAALSGHLVLSTVHAKNVYGVYARLVNLGISKFDLEQTVQLVSYQRLIETTGPMPKVLFDLLTLQDVSWQQIEAKKKGGMTDEWKNRLISCKDSGEITPAILEKYLQG
ncbi:competence protein ComGA [Ligilactobacillus salitolerans]|uniref:Competence protein ComGA n=1 Tax=Ligilactobacillus salitolerans TaxID=1808352 RepID=A0A401ISV8_9LACO|nr:competence type IV pilus ATPase ComGA [Ligilactobacillus salitolerans]GBG94609.1 competence protein ComGA [Ligilactobacillus salitolerans]